MFRGKKWKIDSYVKRDDPQYADGGEQETEGRLGGGFNYIPLYPLKIRLIRERSSVVRNVSVMGRGVVSGSGTHGPSRSTRAFTSHPMLVTTWQAGSFSGFNEISVSMRRKKVRLIVGTASQSRWLLLALFLLHLLHGIFSCLNRG